MNKFIFLFFINLAFAHISFSQSKKIKIDKNIWLTSADIHGDCISSGIFIKKTDFEIAIDKKKCKQFNNDKIRIAECIKNVSFKNDIRFLVHWCGDDKFYIGINGETFVIKPTQKYPKKYPHLVGFYTNKNFTVSVKMLKLLQAQNEEGKSKLADLMIIYSYKALVTITKANVTKSFICIVDEGI
jgi:hypothetical protein